MRGKGQQIALAFCAVADAHALDDDDWRTRTLLDEIAEHTTLQDAAQARPARPLPDWPSDHRPIVPPSDRRPARPEALILRTTLNVFRKT